MTKYRVKEIRNRNETYYVLQERFLLILWRTLEIWDEFEFPIPYGCNRRFYSAQEAIEYIPIIMLNKQEEKIRAKLSGNTIVAKLDKNGRQIVSK